MTPLPSPGVQPGRRAGSGGAAAEPPQAERYPDGAERYPDGAERYPDNLSPSPIRSRIRVLDPVQE